jgi:hypothetical protein
MNHVEEQTATLMPKRQGCWLSEAWMQPVAPMAYRRNLRRGKQRLDAGSTAARAEGMAYKPFRFRGGKVLVFAGLQARNPVARLAVESFLYDPSADKWTAVGDLALGRISASAARLANGKVLGRERRRTT